VKPAQFVTRNARTVVAHDKSFYSTASGFATSFISGTHIGLHAVPRILTRITSTLIYIDFAHLSIETDHTSAGKLRWRYIGALLSFFGVLVRDAIAARTHDGARDSFANALIDEAA
jgi:hypothetical protein